MTDKQRIVKLSKQSLLIEELERRVRDLEARPIYVPYIPYVPVPVPWVPLYPGPWQPQFPNVWYEVTCNTT